MLSGSSSAQRGRKALFAAWLLLLALSGACAQAGEHTDTTTLALDSARSRADFEVKVLWLIGVHGRFGKVHGTVTIDHFRSTALADARIDVGSITMRSRRYEEWVKSDEFFDAQRYPQIRFVSEAIPLERLRNGGSFSGTLTLRGIDKTVTMQLEPSACPETIAVACPVAASGTIRRSDFGMHSRRGTLSDKVELGFSIYLEGPLTEPGHGP